MKYLIFSETRRRSSPSGSLGRRGSSRHGQQQESFSGSDDGEGQQSDQVNHLSIIQIWPVIFTLCKDFWNGRVVTYANVDSAFW